ncbi:histone-lysine N-methyltransferase, H3 lysine-9 specific SUVH4 [Brassica napus]|uniref:histone-lysine N-methyltransferase, H3 lysine-9 specific SUVH4 n=1 Tax=Brassica napus TaxID=3708 RepID=UPI0006AB7358|nr:histone-lysine N-methyltransferase, H3 lysine-9 specific SUVH4 [Brassica napus]
MAGRRKRAKSPEPKERRSSSRVQELRQKERDEKEQLARERVKFLSDQGSELCDDAKEDDVSPNEGTLTTMRNGEDKNLDFYANEEDPHLKVRRNLRFFNTQYLLMVQAKLSRPDLKGITEVMKANAVLYPRKMIGDLPGIDVGHRFFSRAEMVAVGFHSHWLNGIDYMGAVEYQRDYANYQFPLAVSIVMSGQYEDDLDNADVVTYTGQGGHNLTGDKRQFKDQELVRGNLGLKNCFEHEVPVRVIRGHDCKSSYSKRVYTYDGLYTVVKYWAEKGVSGFTVYKYQLKRKEGQPELTTNQVNFMYGRIPKSTSEIQGLVCEDISNGLESKRIPATNRVDETPFSSSGFTYINSLKIEPNVKIPKSSTGCNCRGNCTDPKKCACARLNGGNFPYVDLNDGRLIEPRDVVFECGPNCGCGPECVNRTSQKRLRFHLEVFRSPKKGWAVRSWDFIPAGSPVCEYIGVLRRTDDVDTLTDNDYIFEIDCQQTMQGLDGRQRRLGDVAVPTDNKASESNGDENVPEFCIDAGSTGNFARFINHSCEPNLFVQCVLSSHQDIKLARVVLFAADNIPPLQELTYDYGYTLDSVHGPDGKVKKLTCYCGAVNCRKRLY